MSLFSRSTVPNRGFAKWASVQNLTFGFIMIIVLNLNNRTSNPSLRKAPKRCLFEVNLVAKTFPTDIITLW